MGEDHVRAALAGTTFGDVRWVVETGSTNDDLLVAAGAGAPEGVVLVADHQTAGRGRVDRTWIAPAGSSLLFSVLFRPDLAADETHLLLTALALAAADTCGEVAGVVPELKWPNDLVIGDRKLAGVLAETVVAEGRVEAVVVGMGLNVDWPAELPESLAAIATSLRHQVTADRDLDREHLLVRLLRRLDDRYRDLHSPGGVERLVEEARRRTAWIGERVRVQLADEIIEGTATDVTAAGRLVVETEDGRREVTTGDVVHLRSAAP